MKKIIFTIAALLSTYATSVHAVSVGPYILDDAATASRVTAVSNIASTNGAAALEDLSLTTFMTRYELSSSNASVSLEFDSSLFNSAAGDDLAFYFIRAADEPTTSIFDLSINGIKNNYAASTQTYVDTADGLTKNYSVPFDGGSAEMLIATIDLGDFGIFGTESINALTVSDIDFTDRLALVGGFNLAADTPSPVPVPAAAWLFITGLLSLGFVSRRKR